MAVLRKPASVSRSEASSAKWDELTACGRFDESDVPALTLLCQWYAIVDKCIDDLDYDGEMQVAYQNKMDDIKPMPQIATLKQASSEIRALNKQLGILDGRDEQPAERSYGDTPLYTIISRRNGEKRVANS